MFKLTILLFLIYSVSVCVADFYTDACLASIRKLAEKDKCLSSRLAVKVQKAKTQTESLFFPTVITSKCTGSAYACGFTSSYVAEVFEGLTGQYSEYKNWNDFDGSKIGYSYLTGDQLRNVFSSNKNFPNTIIYKLRMTGDEDHVWIIEQLQFNSGYRIYQSYHDAYSLKAWLSTNINGLYDSVNGDIMLFNEVKAQASGFVKQFTNGKYDLNSNWSNSTEIPQIYKPFLQYVKDYNQHTAISNFNRAWSKYGKGVTLSWNDFQTYVNTLAELSTYFKTNDNTGAFFSQKTWDDWINLFGSPNPVHYPNLPFNAITQFVVPGKTFRFEIKVVKIIAPPQCTYNAYYIY